MVVDTMQSKFIDIVRAAVLIILAIFAMSSTSWAATYYVDATNGDDNNIGLSASNPWKTLSRINKTSFSPGDQILLKRGQIWRETLTPLSSGSEGNPVTFGAYGSGNNPIVDGADLISTWTEEDTNVWKATVPIQPYHVFFDTMKGNEEESIDGIDAEYDWYWDSSILYVYSNSDPRSLYASPGIEAGARQRCIIVNGKNYVALEDIDTKHSGAISSDCDNILIHGSHYVTITGGTTSYGFQDGLIIRGQSSHCTIADLLSHHNGDSTNEGNGIGVFNESSDNNTITNCTAHNNRGDGIVFHGDDIKDYDGPDNGKVSYCKIYRNGEQGIEIYLATNCIVEYNESYENGQVQTSNGEGIKLASIAAKRNTGNVARYNYCHHNLSNGLSTHNEDWFEIYYNVFASNIGYGISVADYTGGKVFNNTIYNSGNAGIVFQGGTISSVELNNNLIDTSQWGLGIRIYSNAIGMFTSDYNLVSDANFGKVDTALYDFSEWKTSTLQDANSIAADPQLIAPAEGNFKLFLSSPCIDAGVNLAVTKDINGSSVPTGKAADIGAFEYNYPPLEPPKFLRIVP